MRTLFLFVLFTFLSSILFAAGPEKIATVDRLLWPYSIENPISFNHASTNEILAFVRVFARTSLENESDIISFTVLEKVIPESVQKWRVITQSRLLKNYQHACRQCSITDWPSLVTESQKVLAEPLTVWADASDKFYVRYLYEQVRLAALFPRITSEIDTLSERQEVTGFELDDGQFLLTYDDGPAADAMNNGERSNRTQALTTALNNLNMHAFFFVLGERMAMQQPSSELYSDQCLGSHGYSHKSHASWDAWASSLQKTRTELARYQAGPYWFRPPYGQRKLPLVDALAEYDEKVMLWNIDSQDWNKKLTDKQVQDRVITLMLLWRKGIILYHDIHGRALQNLPQLNHFAMNAEQQWVDCRTLSLTQRN